MSQYESDEEDNVEQTQLQSQDCSQKRKPKSNNEWLFLEKFDNVEDARLKIESEKCWSAHFRNETFDGLKIYYRCNQVKKSGPTCTCPVNLKFFICKHVVGIACRLKYCKIPAKGKDIPIGEKRKRGRTPKATKALLRR